MPEGRFCWRCGERLLEKPPTHCPGCGQGHYSNPKPTAEAVVVDGDRVLLACRAHDPFQGHWDIPGGFCEEREHPRDAAVRELHEETGLRGEVVSLIGLWIDTYGDPAPDGLQETTLNVSYLLRLNGGPQEPEARDGEATEFGWFALGDPPENLAFPAHARDVLRAAEALLKGSGPVRPLPHAQGPELPAAPPRPAE